MFFKNSLIEQSILTDTIPSILPIDFEKIKSNILKNYAYGKNQNDHPWNYLNNYYHLDDDKNITWIVDYIRDHYRLDCKQRTLVFLDKAGIFQKQNEQINYHHHLYDYDLERSPDMSAIVTIDCGETPTILEFEYQGGRKRHAKWRVSLEKKQIVLFNSELRHSFLNNNNKEPTINLSLKFQLI